jgi:hypothetical protein
MADSVTTMEQAQLADHTLDETGRAGQGNAAAEDNALVFGGETRNMAMGIAMAAAGAAAFVLGLTTTFFAQAIAITFIFWGLFFIYTDLLLSTRSYTVRDDGLEIDVPMRPWSRRRTWAWKDVNRLDVVTYRRDINQEHSNLQVHHQYPTEIALEREDRNFDPALARLIIERAQLKPDKEAAGVDLSNLPTGKDATYTWKK